MKISGWYKQNGHDTELIGWDRVNEFDKIYISKVFTDTYYDESVIYRDNVIYGGTGFFYDKAPPLPTDIEHTMPDYELYSGVPRDKAHEYYHKASIGFTTRGCFRHCDFCVNKNSNRVVKWSDVSEFHDSRNKFISLLDDNVLGYHERVKLISGIIDEGIPFEFKQGMDIRLVNDEVAELFTYAKYHGDFIFAFDDYNDLSAVTRGLETWRKYHSHHARNTKLYILAAYRSHGIDDIISVFERIRVLMTYRCLPYIMRYDGWNTSDMRGMYVTLARWCNQPGIFKNHTFKEFIDKHPIEHSARRYYDMFRASYPDITDKYENMKYGEIDE